MAVWTRNQVTNTDRYVAAVAPLARDPAIQQAIADQVTAQVLTYLDVPGVTDQLVDALAERGLTPLLATQLRTLSGPIASGVEGFTPRPAGRVPLGLPRQRPGDRAAARRRRRAVRHHHPVSAPWAAHGPGPGPGGGRGAFLTGPSATAVRRPHPGRAGLAGAIGWGADRAGLPTGRFGVWVEANKRALQIGAVILACLALVFWSQPTGKVVLGLTLALLVVLALIEFLGRRPAGAPVEAQAPVE